MLFAAGAATTTYGAHYLLSSTFGDRQRRRTTVEEVQRLRAASPPVEPSVLCELYAGFTTQPYRDQPESPRHFLEPLVLQFHGEAFGLDPAVLLYTMAQQRQPEDLCQAALRAADGSIILDELASLNDRDLTVFQQLYEQLLVMAQSPSCHEGIEEELAEIGIRHFNFMDVVCEVVMFRIQAGKELQICPRPGRFLDLLMTVMSSFSATTQQSRPRAQMYFLQVQKAMLVFLESIFTLEEATYEAPESVATTVWEILEDHTEGLLNRLEDI